MKIRRSEDKKIFFNYEGRTSITGNFSLNHEECHFYDNFYNPDLILSDFNFFFAFREFSLDDDTMKPPIYHQSVIITEGIVLQYG